MADAINVEDLSSQEAFCASLMIQGMAHIHGIREAVNGNPLFEGMNTVTRDFFFSAMEEHGCTELPRYEQMREQFMPDAFVVEGMN